MASAALGARTAKASMFEARRPAHASLISGDDLSAPAVRHLHEGVGLGFPAREAKLDLFVLRKRCAERAGRQQSPHAGQQGPAAEAHGCRAVVGQICVHVVFLR
jgi:hypothetical protein